MRTPRVGFLGVGWIGRSRLQAIAETGAVEIVALAEPSDEAAAEALKLASGAQRVADLDALLALGLDGVVIATPSAQHAEESIRALNAGCAVFCQKPLGRTATEVRSVVDAALAADRLLGVDLSYRFTAGMRAVRERIQAGAAGDVFAADLTFHNAWGPDKPWFYDRARSGGGCVIDLGVHLVDLALWALDFPAVMQVTSDLYAKGVKLPPGAADVEDYAVATLVLETGAVLRLACSWNLPAGREAIIEAQFWGTAGGAAFRNTSGSFFDFEAELTQGAHGRQPLADAPEAWGGRAAAAWAQRLADGDRFDPAARELIAVADVLDRIYAGSPIN